MPHVNRYVDQRPHETHNSVESTVIPPPPPLEIFSWHNPGPDILAAAPGLHNMQVDAGFHVVDDERV